ncbi:MAG: hypothetical protein WDN75_10780 [Bacteroidota bacterium]
MIDMLSSPLYSNQVTAALKESGTAVLQVLDTAFYKSGQTDQVMLKNRSDHRAHRRYGSLGSSFGKNQTTRISGS